jgi:hypothetical protein
VEDSLIRFACVTLPQMDTAGIAFDYCEAAAKTGLGVRIMPIGVMHFGIEPWNRVSNLFLTPLKTRFINVVCIEPGVNIPTAQFGWDEGKDAAYEAPLALTGLMTVGIPNVAIVSGLKLPEGKELEALKLYTEVICPTREGSDALQAVGVKSTPIPADPDLLSRLFSGMMPI